ncbi:molecular chaperone [Gallibacterium salpingitidis]|uniref:TorD/DmsD family molecular chaperone n=1 Tax=Gallibacterium salpingitidis TaxID=505341 RepID=UPI00082485C7|nr:molecular chaperone TorD family protein [Gallibacterium salpingitidis]
MNYLFTRHYIYDLLRRLFIEEPNIDLLIFLKENKLINTIYNELSENQEICNLYKSWLDELLNKNISSHSDDYQELHWDFTQLFVGPHILPAPPWESSYKGDYLLFTETTANVEKYYQQYSFYLPEREIEAADHIGFELDFIYHLNQKALTICNELSELEFNLKAQYMFLIEHLLSFIHLFSLNIQQYAQTDFYKKLAHFIEEFIKFDSEKINSLLLQMQNNS